MSESMVGPWAKDKLERLQKYLHAYTTIMRGQDWCEGFHYIDAFAGPGRHQIRPLSSVDGSQLDLLELTNLSEEEPEQQQFISGSPRVALDLEFPFSWYVFVEQSPARIASLKALSAEYGSTRNIAIREGDCTTFLRERVAISPTINWRKNRAVVFLDPFGMQVEWETIKLLADTKAIEVILNFPVGMAIQRLLLRKPENFTDAQRQKLDQYFGSPDWWPAIYRPQKSLFGDDEVHSKVEDSGKALMQWYSKQLKTIFPQVSRAALIRNTKGGHLYYLLLASHNAVGKKIFDNVLASAGEVV